MWAHVKKEEALMRSEEDLTTNTTQNSVQTAHQGKAEMGRSRVNEGNRGLGDC
jgi:hypothetical protein